jgi:hypothetical protein
MNRLGQENTRKNNRSAFLEILNEFHARSGMSLREAAQACDLDHTYLHYILAGLRRPRRDVIIALGFAYGMHRVEVDEVLLLAGYPPIGRSSLKEFRSSLSDEYSNK